MRAPRFFVSGILAPGDAPALDAADARKAQVVLRMRAGDELEIVDSSGRAYAATLASDGAAARALVIRETRGPLAPRLRITLAQGVPKGRKMDYVVEKATELGVERILAFTASRTAGDRVRDGKSERWARVAKSAAAQCGRSDVPEVDGPVEFAALVERVRTAALALVAWEVADPVALRDRLPQLIEGRDEALVVIGPEGGLSHAETADLEAAGAVVVSLGRRILRTETAGLVACAALRYAAGDL